MKINKKLIIGTTCVGVLLIAVVFIQNANKTRQPEVAKDVDQVSKTAADTSPAVHDSIEKYISFSLPKEWTKKVSKAGGEDYLTVYSPDYSYNTTRKDDGMRIVITRNKSTTSPKEVIPTIIQDSSKYIPSIDRTIYAVEIGGLTGYKYMVWNDMAYDVQYPHITLIDDDIQWDFSFIVFDGTSHRNEVDSFLSSINFN